ncbi:PHP domain-containing protein [Thermocrinis sp.]|uniref:PHP domain-containing protein n=1 Tax=Thermocrinis sp. TaxID=2024383 RepID=UPI002FDE4965
MIDTVLLIIFASALYILVVFLFPFKWIKAEHVNDLPEKIPNLFVYSYQVHIHTQFSYDSLGKPEDIFSAMEREGIDFALITDHDNDSFKHFCNNKTIAGVERKINGKDGILGDLLEIGKLKIIAHPFKEKYRWKLNKEGYFLELIDLKDALLEDKKKLFFFLPAVMLLYPFIKEKSLEILKKVIDVKSYAVRYIQEGWNNPILGGLDHHTKIYVREVGKRILFPSYSQSFYLMRNFLITNRPVNSATELLDAMLLGLNLISFQRKVFLAYKDGANVRVLSPYENFLALHITERSKRYYQGCNLRLPIEEGRNVYVGFLYSFKLKNIYFGIKPALLFVLSSPPELFSKNVEKASSGMGI